MDYKVTDTELTSIANAIRTKGGTSAQLEFPDDFIDAIGDISGGGAKNILSGTDAPTSAEGEDGDIYLHSLFVPTGAKRVEYIESSGTQWIDTLFTPDQDSGIELDVVPVRKYGSSAGQGWCDVSVSTSSNRFGIVADYGEGKIQFNYNTYHYGSTFTSGNRYKVALLKNKAYIDGSLVDTYTAVTISTSATLPLFSSRYNSSNPSRPSATKLYSCKIWDDDVLVRNFIPVLDANDVPCLYDCVNGTYYYNQGTGDFSYGNELNEGEIIAAYCKVNGAWQSLVGTDIDDVDTEGSGGIQTGTIPPTSDIGSDGDYYKQTFPLPSNVNFVEYLQSSGTQYIDTGIIADQGTDFYAKCYKTGDTHVFGVRTGSASSATNALIVAVSTNSIGASKSTSSIDQSAYRYTASDPTEVETKSSLYSDDSYSVVSFFNGEAKNLRTPKQAAFQSNGSMIMFGARVSGTVNKSSGAKIYHLTITQEHVPIADYLPCIDGNGVACMWDNVAGEYVYNDGTGDFTYGGTVTPDELEPILWVKESGTWRVVGS